MTLSVEALAFAGAFPVSLFYACELGLSAANLLPPFVAGVAPTTALTAQSLRIIWLSESKSQRNYWITSSSAKVSALLEACSDSSENKAAAAAQQ